MIGGVIRALGLGVLVALSLGVLLWAADRPARESGRLAAVFPPHMAPQAALARLTALDVRILGTGGSARVFLVESEQPGLAGQLRAAGAILVLDPDDAGGCMRRQTGASDMRQQ